MNRGKVLYLVVPCYNEELVLDETIKQLSEQLDRLISIKKISNMSKICFVDDGSIDDTWNIIKKNQKNKYVSGLKLSHNRGHQAALLAGLLNVKDYCDMAITIDADLQQDVSSIEKFVDKYLEGNDIVYGIRNSRSTDKFLKRTTATFFYNTMKKFGCETIKNCADYRLTSKKVLEELNNYKEKNLYLRGLFPYMGFKTDYVYFDVFERYAGSSKYNLKKMLALATDGITSFSYEPLRIILYFGVILSILSLIGIIMTAILALKKSVFTTLIIISSIFFAAGLIISCIGIIGEYIGKLFIEVKNRPVFSIEEYAYENIKKI